MFRVPPRAELALDVFAFITDDFDELHGGAVVEPLDHVGRTKPDNVLADGRRLALVPTKVRG